jgi:hypothetical protein
MEKGNQTIGMLVAAFVCLFLGLALLGVVASSSNTLTTNVGATERINIQAALSAKQVVNPAIEFYPQIANDSRTGWRSDTSGCTVADVANSYIIGNDTQAFVAGLDYGYSTTNGSIRFMNSYNVNGTLGNVTTVSYLKCPNDYVVGWAGKILNLVPGFFALALLGCSIALFYGVAKINGIL